MKNFLSTSKKKAMVAAVAAGICFCNLTQVNAADFPIFFDWRLNNPTDRNSGTDELSIVSPVEKQEFGTCWTFSTFGSYESSWLKQLKAAQAAGYNVTPGRTIFSEYYLAWTTFMPPADNSTDASIYEKIGFRMFGIDHLIYDQGGKIEQAVSGLLKNGAVDENSVTFAETDEQKNYVTTLINTEANINRLKDFSKNHLAVFGFDPSSIEDLSESERHKIFSEYMNSFTNEEIQQFAQEILNGEYDVKVVEKAVMETVTPKGILHDTYIVKHEKEGNGLTAEQISDTKELIQTEGIVLVNHTAVQSLQDTNYFNDGEINPFETLPDHAESLVGWDDNYIFKNYTNADGSPIQGAFIIRNSWGTASTVEKFQGTNYNGYGYLAYQDTSTTGISFFNAGLDAKRYTINQNNAPAIDAVDFFGILANSGTQAIANSFTAETDSGQFLKAVMFYVSEKNMPYEIIVREGETPGEGTILTQQSGTFGEDGTPKWGGYRTVDLDNFVFLAKDKKYTVEVKTTSPTGQTVYVALMAGQDLTNSPRLKAGDSAIINQSLKREVLQGLLQWSLPQPYFLYFNKRT